MREAKRGGLLTTLAILFAAEAIQAGGTADGPRVLRHASDGPRERDPRRGARRYPADLRGGHLAHEAIRDQNRVALRGIRDHQSVAVHDEKPGAAEPGRDDLRYRVHDWSDRDNGRRRERSHASSRRPPVATVRVAFRHRPPPSGEVSTERYE